VKSVVNSELYQLFYVFWIGSILTGILQSPLVKRYLIYLPALVNVVRQRLLPHVSRNMDDGLAEHLGHLILEVRRL
jgi:hypothetical protein